MAAPVEREAKLGAWPGFTLPDLGGLASWVRPGAPREQELVATYYDAPDLRLVRAGVTVRYRTGEDAPGEGRWTGKVPNPAGGDGEALDRYEIDVAGPPGRVPAELVSLVRGRLRTAELAPVATLATRRRLIPLLDGGGRRLGEVADDEVSVLAGERVAARFREVEAEVKTDAPATLLPLVVERLRAAGAGEADPTPKLMRALGPQALVPPEPVVPELDKRATIGDVVRAAIAGAVQRLALHDPIARLDAAPIGVHQSRVAMRRLRSDLRTFAPVIDQEWADTLVGDVRWLAQELGRVRDADVLLARLLAAADELPGPDADSARGVLRRLRAERDEALAELRRDLDSPRYLTLLDRLVDAGRAPRLLEGAARPAVAVLPELVTRPWRKLRQAVAELDGQPSDDDLHQVRIRAKRARYAAEAASVVLPKAAVHAKAIAKVQEVLGDQHDAVVAEAWLRGAVANGEDASPQQALAVGSLVAAERAEAAAQRATWRAAWDAANAKKVRAWLSS